MSYLYSDGLAYWRRLRSVWEAAKPFCSCGSATKSCMSRAAAASSGRRKKQTSSSNSPAARTSLMKRCPIGSKNAAWVKPQLYLLCLNAEYFCSVELSRFFFMLWLLCLRRCSGPKLRCRPPCRFSMNWEISWNSRWTHQQLLPSNQITSLLPNGFLLWNKRLLDSSPLCR